MEQNQMKVVYVISRRSGRSFWTRVGVAFPNRDGSLNLKLEVIPLDGELHVRDYVPRASAEPEAEEGNPARAA